MSSTPTAASTISRSTARAPRWKAAQPEIRVGIDLDDNGFRLAAIRLSAHCTELDSPELKVEWLHRVAETTPDIKSNLTTYLDALAARLPRSASQGGLAASIAMPPALQSLRCVASTQLVEAERSIAEELGGAIQSRSWPVGSQKSMICGIRRDIAESLIAILETAGYRCESILPRSIALARTHLAASQSQANHATIFHWGRHRSLVSMVHDRTIRLCREFVLLDNAHTRHQTNAETSNDFDAGQDRLATMVSEVADELCLTLQHAARLDNRISSGPIIVCGEMSAATKAIDSFRLAMANLQGVAVTPWSLSQETSLARSSAAEDQANVVAVSLAIGGSKVAIDQLLIGSKTR